MLNKNKPIVLAFGWLGAHPYNMHSFEKIYNGMGLEYKSIIQSYLSVLNVTNDQKKFDAMYNAAKGRDIFCHIFSLNGASSFVSSLMKKDLSGFKEGINVKSIIWDSSPGTSPDFIYHKAFAKSLFPSSKLLSSVTSAMLMPVFSIFLHNAKAHKARSKYLIDYIFSHPFTMPQLMLGSKHDYIIKYEDMKRYYDTAKDAGVDIHSRFWDDSDHVRLYHDHKQEYINLVKDFTAKQLDKLSKH